jgi:hypothetical protein
MSCHTSFGYNSLTGNCYSSAPSVSPASPNHSVQFNELNQFAGDGRFVYDQTTGILDVPTVRPDTIIDETDSDGTNGQYLTSTGTGIEWTDLPAYPTPAAPFDSVQFNDSGDFGGDSAFTYNSSTNTLAVTNVKPTTITDDVNSIGTAGQYLTSTGTGVDWATLPTYPTPGAPVNSIQFNNGGTFGGDSDFTYNSSTNIAYLNGSLGIGAVPTNAQLLLSQTIANRKFVIYDVGNNNHQFYGIGINTATMRFQTPSISTSFAWFSGIDAATSYESMRLTYGGTAGGLLTVGGSTATPATRLFALSNSGAIGLWDSNWFLVGNGPTGSSAGIGLAYNTAGNHGIIAASQPGSAWKDIRYYALVHSFYNNGLLTMNMSSVGELVVGTASTSTVTVSKSTLASAAPLTIPLGTYLKLGGNEYRTNSYRVIGFGYNTGSNSQPAYIGFFEDLQTSETYGSLIFGTRSVTTNTLPTQRLRISPIGDIIVSSSLASPVPVGLTYSSPFIYSPGSRGLFYSNTSLVSGVLNYDFAITCQSRMMYEVLFTGYQVTGNYNFVTEGRVSINTGFNGVAATCYIFYNDIVNPATPGIGGNPPLQARFRDTSGLYYTQVAYASISSYSLTIQVSNWTTAWNASASELFLQRKL